MDQHLIQTDDGIFEAKDLPLLVPDSGLRHVATWLISLIILFSVAFIWFEGQSGSHDVLLRAPTKEIQAFDLSLNNTWAKTIYLWGSDLSNIRINGQPVEQLYHKPQENLLMIILPKEVHVSSLHMEGPKFPWRIVIRDSKLHKVLDLS